jgi:hypothetical protein
MLLEEIPRHASWSNGPAMFKRIGMVFSYKLPTKTAVGYNKPDSSLYQKADIHGQGVAVV